MIVVKRNRPAVLDGEPLLIKKSMPKQDPKQRKTSQAVQTVDGVGRFISRHVKERFAVGVHRKRNEKFVRLLSCLQLNDFIASAGDKKNSKYRENHAEIKSETDKKQLTPFVIFQVVKKRNLTLR